MVAAADEFVRGVGTAAAEAAGGGYVDLGAVGLLDRMEEGFEALQWRLLVDEAGHQAGAGGQVQVAQRSVGSGIGRRR